MKSGFRETSPQDGPAVSVFLRRIFEIDSTLPLTQIRHLHWKCWEQRSDWPGSRGYVLTRDDMIVAHGTVVPLSWVSDQQRLRMIHLIDWAADPNAVGGGVTLLKQIARKVDAVIVVGGSVVTQKVLPALGFKTIGEVTNFARPLRPLKRLTGQPFSLRSVAQSARCLLWSLRVPKIPVRGWTASRIEAEYLPASAIRWPLAEAGIANFERTNESMSYFLKCPVAPMELYAVARDGTARGYFMLAYAPGQARIVDFYLDSGDQEDWRTLIQLAVTQASQNAEVAEVVSMGSDPVTCQALGTCGFHERGNTTIRLLPGSGVTLPTGLIRFHMIDGDASYLHANQNSFWA